MAKKEHDGYWIDIQRNIVSKSPGETYVETTVYTDTLSLHIGLALYGAYETFNMLVANNLAYEREGGTIEYMRLRYVSGQDVNVVLTRKTPSGQGDW